VRSAAFVSVLWCAMASSAGAQSSSSDEVSFAADLNRRSDSLSGLNAATELKIATTRGDWRFLGVAGYVVVAPGVGFSDPLYPEKPADIRVIEGTSDLQVGEVGKRYNMVAALYAEQYNRLLLERLRKLKTRR
jgi:hypothetical protein